MLPKAHLTSHSRMSGSRWVWVIPPSWLSGLWRSFLYSSCMYSCHLFLISSPPVQISRSVMSDSLQPHYLQHARPLCPSPTTRVYPNPCPSSWWCHPAISSSVIPFSSCPQSYPALGSFPMSQLFTWGGQSTGVSASTSVLPMNTQDWSPLGWTGWISLQSKGLSSVFSNTTVKKHQFFGAQLSSQSNSHIHTWPLQKPQPWLDRPCWQSNVSAFKYAIQVGHNFHSKE